MDINQKLHLLRQKMAQNNIDAVIIPSGDPHQSEYVSPHWQERVWISGFTGSAGTVVVTKDHAGLWTDSRYFLQADMELSGTEFVLHKMFNQFGLPYVEFISDNLHKGAVIGINGFMFSKSQVDSIKKAGAANQITVNHRCDIISEIWQDRPSLSHDPITLHEEKYAGRSIAEKLKVIRNEMSEWDADYHLITSLDDIGWALNIRGTDVEYNPVAISYAVIGKTDSHLFVHAGKLLEETSKKLAENHVIEHPYSEILSFLNNLDKSQKILVDPDVCSQTLYEAINAQIINGPTIPRKLKAVKNETEIKYIRSVMKKDGAALAHAFHWIEKSLEEGHTFNEVDVANKLAEYRSQQDFYQNESFAAIVGYRGNGAIVHYHAMPDTCKTIQASGVLLVDSGGQYRDGTTDITRTFTLGNTTAEEKRAYTLILKGNIALSRAKFPEGTTGVQLDILARQFLWQNGMNYGHGTGHGVGFFMNVHEPPQGIVNNFSERGKTIHVPGMLTSNEPGFYKENDFGMRIETLILCKQSDSPGFLDFETVTLYPFDHGLIDKSLLTSDEIDWINEYHKRSYDGISPYLEGELKEWFKNKCRSL